MRSDVAIVRNSSGISSAPKFTSIPMPSTTCRMWSSSAPSSSNMPATFRVPKTMSLGHLISGFSPVWRSIPRATATALTTVNCVAAAGGSCGRSSTENQRPLPDGDIHCRPRRPRPRVCDSAKTTMPSRTESRAIFSTTSLVEAVTWKTWISRPMSLPGPKRARRSSACRRSGEERSW